MVQSVETNERYTEALVTLSDGSLLGFVHGVDERRVKSFEPDGGNLPGRADEFLDRFSVFCLNLKYLEVLCDDGCCSEWIPPASS